MNKILVPVDGSESAQHAVEYVADLSTHGAQLAVELLNVQIPIVSGYIPCFVSQEMIDNDHCAEAEEALKPAKRLLDGRAVPYKATMLVGHIAETIADYAVKHHCNAIVMGTRGMDLIKNLILGSVATQVIHLADIPVTLVK